MNCPVFKVCIRCFTYNQSKFIVDTLDGFTMQKTNFPYVCCVVDDASTDGEQKIIIDYFSNHFDTDDKIISYKKETEYAFISFAQHKTNKNCFFAILFLKENHYRQKKPKVPYLSEWRKECEYEAICEGDDYWTCNTKLQEQFDVMKNHPNVSICSGGYQTKQDDKLGDIILINKENDFFYTLDDFGKRWIAKTLTIMYRISSLNEYAEKRKYYKFSRDTHLIYHLLRCGDGYYFSKVLGVYNKHAGGICSLISKKQKEIDWYNCWNEIYENNKDEISRKQAFNGRNSIIRLNFPNAGNKVMFLVKTIKLVRSPMEFFVLLKSVSVLVVSLFHTNKSRLSNKHS